METQEMNDLMTLVGPGQRLARTHHVGPFAETQVVYGISIKPIARGLRSPEWKPRRLKAL